MKRRNFLKATSTAVSLPLLFNGMRLSAMPKPSLFDSINSDNDRVLVLIQLNGGNDGLNTLLPLDQYDKLFPLRSNVIVPENDLIKLNDNLGLHPEMSGFKNLFDQGKLGIVHSVGYPNQNRSHFRSMDIWQSGSPAEETWTTGWLGRHFQEGHDDFPEAYPNETYPHPFAITMGNVVSETCQGTAANFSLTLSDPFALSPLAEGNGGETPDTPYGKELDFLRITIAQSNQYAEEITIAAEKGNNRVEYPENNNLAQQLKNIALMISGGLQTKVYVASLGGFDTHANQVEDGNTGIGVHATLLRNLSEAIAAFQEDLQAMSLEERVLGLTFSEFGRQIRSNFSFGTDHGTAAPLFLFGSCTNPSVLGQSLEIPDEVQVQEGIPMQYDFRDIYGSILEDWFEVEEMAIKTLLHPSYNKLPIIQDCRVATDTEQVLEPEILLNAYPNPFRSQTNIQFSAQGGIVRLSIYNAMGSELKVLINKKLPKGTHKITWDATNLAAGNYYYRYQEGMIQKTMHLIKVR